MRAAISHRARTGGPLWLAEVIATFGLLAVIWGCARLRRHGTPFAVAAYIVGAYLFTSSTSFANSAVMIARSLSDTFAGIRPDDVAPLIAMQFGGAMAATGLFAWFNPTPRAAEDALSPLSSQEAFDHYDQRPELAARS